MRNRLAAHFGFIGFGLIWAVLCLTNQGTLASLGGAALFGAFSALVGWLSFSEAGRAWSALRTVGWTPLVALIVGASIMAFEEPKNAAEVLEVAAWFAVGSLFLLPLYVPIAMLTPRT